MKWKCLLLSLSVVALLPQSGVTAGWSDTVKYERGGELFNPNEFQVDMFGTYATRDKFGEKGDHWGGGLGLNYFPSKYIGIGADSYLEEWKWPYRVNGSLFFRLPIQPLGIAPYAFGGGGREFKYDVHWTVHGGAGLEFRLNRHTGFFGDARRVFDMRDGDIKDNHSWLARAGLRLAF